MEETIATAVNKEPFSLKKMFMRCLPLGAMNNSSLNRDSSGAITALRCQIGVNDVKGCRKITLKGLYGDQELLQHFIASFRTKVTRLVKSGGSEIESSRGNTNSNSQMNNISRDSRSMIHQMTNRTH